MSTAPKHNHFFKLLSGMAILMIICIYSCNGTASKEEKKDTAATAPIDTSMKMKTDTAKTDTAGKGGQPAPAGH